MIKKIFRQITDLINQLTSRQFREYNLERIMISTRFFRESWQSFSREKVGRIAVDNSSGGILKPLIDPFFVPLSDVRRVLLVSEPPVAADQVIDHILSHFDKKTSSSSQDDDLRRLKVETLEAILGVEWSDQEPNFDLASSQFADYLAQVPGFLAYDLVVSQSLLEHVMDPVQVLRNLGLLTTRGGILAIQTCNPVMRLHRYPIDTLRFHSDFFYEFATKNGLEAIVENSGASIFAFLSTKFSKETADAIKGSFA